jgi:hypothetical protein
LLLAKNHDGDFTALKILLVAQVFVCSQQQIKPGLFRCG